MSKPNARVELRCACQTLLQSWHAEQNQAKPPSIVHITDLLETRILEAVGFIDNQQLDERRRATGHQKVFFALMALIGGLHQVREGGEHGHHLAFDAPWRSRYWGRIEHRSTLQDGDGLWCGSEGKRFIGIQAIHRAAPGEGDQRLRQEWLDMVPLRVIPGRLGFSRAWRSISQADRLRTPTDIV